MINVQIDHPENILRHCQARAERKKLFSIY